MSSISPDAGTLPPTFETERLGGRLPVPSDAAHLYAAYASNPLVSHYMVWRPHTDLSATEVFLADCIAAAQQGTRFPYVLVERGSTTPIGMLEARHNGHTVDIGYVIAPQFWGRGYMPEAITALAKIALALPQVFRVQASCDIENRPSQRALEKAGFVREARHERHTLHPNMSSEPRPCYMYALCR